MHGNDFYQNIMFMDSPTGDDLNWLNPELDTPGKAWNVDGHYPLTFKLLLDRHPSMFRDQNGNGKGKDFFFRNFTDPKTQQQASKDDIMRTLEAFDNPMKAMMLASNPNENIRRNMESIIKGKFEDYKFTITETFLDEEDRLNEPETK